MVKNVTRIDAGITVTVDVSVRNIMHVGKVKFRILVQVIVKMEKIWQILWMIQRICVTKSESHMIIKQKQSQHILMKRKRSAKRKTIIYYLHFY